MASIIEEFLRPIVRSFLSDQTHALFVRAASWLDANIAGRSTKIVIGMILGLAAFFSVPIVIGLLGF